MNEKAKEILRIQGKINRLLKEESYLSLKEGKNNEEWHRLQRIGPEVEKLKKEIEDLRGMI